MNKINQHTHVCYILQSSINNNIYVGYTIDFNRRIRQHNGEISGGAKKTMKFRPWYPICIISGFFERTSALRFEYRLQKILKKDIFGALTQLIESGDGKKDSKIPWPVLTITWYIGNINYNVSK